MSCEDRVGDWRDSATSQGTPRAPGNHQKPGERRGMDSLAEPPERTSSSDTLISDFWSPEL